jgi:ribosomal protein S27E
MNNFNQINLPAGVQRILWLLLIVWVLGATSFGSFVMKSVLFVMALLTVLPVVGFFGLQWWLKSNLVQSQCPVCQHEFNGFNGQTTQCPSCGEMLQIEAGKFKRMAEPGVIDVDVVEVSASVVEDADI